MNSSQGKNEFYEKQLETLAKQLEGEVDCRLSQKRYRLSVFAPYKEGETIHYGEFNGEGRRYYPVPDVRTAILILDILCCEYRLLDMGFFLYDLQYWDEETGKWITWYDGEGNDFASYILDENFVPHLEGDDDDDDE